MNRFQIYASVHPLSVRLAFLSVQVQLFIAILQKVKDRVKYHVKLAKMYCASCAQLYSVD